MRGPFRLSPPVANPARAKFLRETVRQDQLTLSRGASGGNRKRRVPIDVSIEPGAWEHVPAARRCHRRCLAAALERHEQDRPRRTVRRVTFCSTTTTAFVTSAKDRTLTAVPPERCGARPRPWLSSPAMTAIRPPTPPRASLRARRRQGQANPKPNPDPEPNPDASPMPMRVQCPMPASSLNIEFECPNELASSMPNAQRPSRSAVGARARRRCTP